MGRWHGCQGVCVQPNPEDFPSKKGLLIDKEPKREIDISQDWKDWNCPKNQDMWYDTMWVQLEGEIGHITFDGAQYQYEREEQDARLGGTSEKKSSNYVLADSLIHAQALCDADENCYGVTAEPDSHGRYAIWTPVEQPLYYRYVLGGKKIWVKNPFTSALGVFEASKSTDECADLVTATNGQINTPSQYDMNKDCKVYGVVQDAKGDPYTLSRAMRGADNGVCSVPNQQKDETPWVRRPMISGVTQKYDEPNPEYKVGGYGYVYDWGYDEKTGITTVRDLYAPTVVSVKKCEVMPDFTLRCQYVIVSPIVFKVSGAGRCAMYANVVMLPKLVRKYAPGTMERMTILCAQAMVYVTSVRKVQDVVCAVVTVVWLQQVAFYPCTKTRISGQNLLNRIGVNSGITIRAVIHSLTVS